MRSDGLLHRPQHTRSTNVQMAGFCIRRKMMTIAEFGFYRGREWLRHSRRRDAHAAFRLDRRHSRKGYDSAGHSEPRGVNYQPGAGSVCRPRLARSRSPTLLAKPSRLVDCPRERMSETRRTSIRALPFLNWCYVNALGSFYVWIFHSKVLGSVGSSNSAMADWMVEPDTVLRSSQRVGHGAPAQTDETPSSANWEQKTRPEGRCAP